MQSYLLKVLRVGEAEPSMRLTSPEVARRYWNAVIKKQPWFDEEKENLVVLLLSTRFNIEGYSIASIGTLNDSIAHPREIFRAAVAGGCYGIVVMHNHPSGDPSPSDTDHSLTRRLRDSANLLQIQLVDHVIVGRRRLRQLTLGKQKSWKLRNAEKISRRGYFSFKDAGIL